MAKKKLTTRLGAPIMRTNQNQQENCVVPFMSRFDKNRVLYGFISTRFSKNPLTNDLATAQVYLFNPTTGEVTREGSLITFTGVYASLDAPRQVRQALKDVACEASSDRLRTTEVRELRKAHYPMSLVRKINEVVGLNLMTRS